jgi:hypothetical protein
MPEEFSFGFGFSDEASIILLNNSGDFNEHTDAHSCTLSEPRGSFLRASVTPSNGSDTPQSLEAKIQSPKQNQPPRNIRRRGTKQEVGDE